jgi:hypothetical protein
MCDRIPIKVKTHAASVGAWIENISADEIIPTTIVEVPELYLDILEASRWREQTTKV